MALKQTYRFMYLYLFYFFKGVEEHILFEYQKGYSTRCKFTADPKLLYGCY